MSPSVHDVRKYFRLKIFIVSRKIFGRTCCCSSSAVWKAVLRLRPDWKLVGGSGAWSVLVELEPRESEEQCEEAECSVCRR